MIRYFDLLPGLLLAIASVASAQMAPAPSPPPPAQASPTGPQDQPAIDFHAALAPFGTWRTLQPLGEVWVPSNLPAGWRPYTTGHWVFSQPVGWTWVDDAPWGWAPFHYGRWTLDASLGWVWIPGNVWGPAWVAWRECDGFVGWAPLPPSVTWSAGVGLFFGGVDLAFAIGAPWWSFVPIGHLCHPHVTEVLLVPERVTVVLRDSHLVERGLVLRNGHPVNRSLGVERIEQATGQPVKRVILRDVNAAEVAHGAPLGPDEVAVFRPHAQERPGALVTRAPESPRAPVQAAPEAAPERNAPAQPHPMHQPHQQRWHPERERQTHEHERDR